MRKSLELKQQAEKVYEKAKALLAAASGRDLNEQERKDTDTFNAQIETLLADAKRFEKIESLELGRPSSDVDAAALARTEAELTEEERAAALARRKAPKVFMTLGHQLASIYAVATGRPVQGVTLEETRNRLLAAATGQGEVIDADGGFALQTDFASSIEKHMYIDGQVLSRLSPIGISSNSNRLVERFIDETSRATGSRWGAVRGYWVDEGDSITASKIKFDQMKTELNKIAALGYVSNELLDDYSAMSDLFIEAFADELRFLTEDAIIEGDGQGKPLGLTAAPCKIAISAETNQPTGTILTRNLSKMWQRFPTRCKGSAAAVWLIHSEANIQLDELTIPAGTAAVEPRFVNYGPDGILRIKGKPVVEVEYCSALGTEGDIILTDFSQYRFINKGGVNQSQSMHVRFANDETAFKCTYRAGGQPKWKSAITPFKGTGTVSPIITLATR
jgi:HK97 family phage major capsid protein